MERSFFAPGRVNLIGEYTDLIGGLVLPAALDLGLRLDVRPAKRITLRSDRAPDTAVADADGSNFDGTGWTRYVAAVAAELAELGRPPIGITGAITSTLPMGAGLSSSAALSVGLTVALCGVADFPLEPLELAQAARRAEQRASGVPMGILDQAASVLGREGHAVLLDTSTLEYEFVPIPRQLAIVVVDSGVSRSLEHSQYAVRKSELDRARTPEADVDETLARRRRHMETENERVLAVAQALRTRDYAQLGELFRQGHASLRDDLEVTTPELDRLVELAYADGAVAARMTGGGFGGSIVALAEVSHARTLADAVVSEYGGGRAYVCAASDGARELT